MKLDCQLAVIGGGSGGFAAALAAARLGLSVVLVEQAECLGGLSTRGGVNCWEMGVGGTGLPYELYLRLRQIPRAVGLYAIDRHLCFYRPEQEPYRFPGGLSIVDPELHYLDSLRRYGSRGLAHDEAFCRRTWHGVVFEPQAMASVMMGSLRETGRCQVLLNTPLREVTREGDLVKEVTLTNGGTLSAEYFVDATGEGVLCAAAGCEQMLGQEARRRFDEPDAPPEANGRLNGVSLIYRATRRPLPAVDPLPANIPPDCWWATRFPSVSVNTYPNGDLNLNMLPTMEGEECVRLGRDAAYQECHRRVLSHWHYLQTDYAEFREYEICWIAPMLGVRETRRLLTEYVLNENDLLAGVSGQQHTDLIALADHALDTHGAGTGRAGCGELSQPYGIPYRCLVPRGLANVLIACRAAGFSSLAASSCRLSRTMMALGQAAGTAVALARSRQLPLPLVPAHHLRQALRDQHCQVDWPMPAELGRYLGQEVSISSSAPGGDKLSAPPEGVS